MVSEGETQSRDLKLQQDHCASRHRDPAAIILSNLIELSQLINELGTHRDPGEGVKKAKKFANVLCGSPQAIEFVAGRPGSFLRNGRIKRGGKYEVVQRFLCPLISSRLLLRRGGGEGSE